MTTGTPPVATPPETNPPETNPPVTLRFLGAAETVTGSRFLLTIGQRRILVDAGLFQGEKPLRERNWEPFAVDPSTISDVLLTHAHADHCAYLPRLVKDGFRGRVHATAGTIALAEIVLRDSARLQEGSTERAVAGGYSKHAPPLPLYDTHDVEETLPLLRAVPFDDDVDLGGGITARWTRAGHILASASVTVTASGTSVLFSGDLGRHDHPLLRSRDVPAGADHVVIESTYGDREHPESTLPHEPLAAAIRRTVERGGSVVVPAFAIDRTETVLHALVQLWRAGRIPHVPVYVDGPMSLRALDVYRAMGASELAPGNKLEDFLGLPDLRLTPETRDSIAIARHRGPAVIITSSGMAEGGRVLHHLRRLLPDPRNTVIITGYQAVGTRGRALLEGTRHVKIHGHYVPVRAEIVQDEEFSVHGDASDLIDWLRALDRAPETVFVVHGEATASATLARRVTDELGWLAVVPRDGEVVALTDGGVAGD